MSFTHCWYNTVASWADLVAASQFNNDVPTTAAIYSGLLSETVPNLPLSCPTGNCTWPRTPTLAMCGACTNLEHEIVSACSNDTCTWSLPGGLTVTRPRVPPTSGDDEWRIQTTMFQAGRSSGISLQNAGIVGAATTNQTNLIAFEFLGLSSSKFWGMNQGVFALANKTPFNKENLTASECGLWWCSQTREASAVSGVSTETVVDTLTPWNASWSWDIGQGWQYPVQDTLNYVLTGEITVGGNYDMSKGSRRLRYVV